MEGHRLGGIERTEINFSVWKSEVHDEDGDIWSLVKVFLLQPHPTEEDKCLLTATRKDLIALRDRPSTLV